MSYIWVKVITANPLKGPCEGQVQFIVDWERRKAVHRNWVWFSFGGQRRKTALEGGYATVYANFKVGSNYLYEWLRMGVNGDGQEFLLSNTGDNPNFHAWLKATTMEPPAMRTFVVYLANENAERTQQREFTHWDAFKLCRKLIGQYWKPYYARQARDGGIDGDDLHAMASVYGPNEQCETLHVINDGPAVE